MEGNFEQEMKNLRRMFYEIDDSEKPTRKQFLELAEQARNIAFIDGVHKGQESEKMKTEFEVEGKIFVETLEEQCTSAMNGGYKGYITGPANERIEFQSGWYEMADYEERLMASDSFPMLYTYKGKNGRTEEVWNRIESHREYIKNLIQGDEL